MNTRLLIRRVTLLALLLGVFATASPARAYPPGSGTQVGTDRSTYTVGSKVFITARGFVDCEGKTIVFTIFTPGSAAQIVVNSTVDQSGAATVSIAAPAALGQYTVVASSDGCRDASTTFVTGRLPQTGSDTKSWVFNASALLCTGLGLWFVARRRRRAVAAE